MKHIIALVFLFILLISFGSCKNELLISAGIHQPHCGGAPPTAELSNRPLTDKIIIVGVKDSIVVDLSNSGESKVRLANGSYQWYQYSKSLNTEVTYALTMKVDRNLFEFIGLPCIEQWKKTADGFFSVNSDMDTVKLELRSNCYSRLVPCLKYIGPMYE
ncbi:MAG: hypothetical protein QNL43_00035 [Crocinitomicaceae bacterium]|jgi:hypothetical protein|tara:strand:- start:9585 stop:10064 length:480 start_codon:yes stop_codon:yes gene_type:complete